MPAEYIVCSVRAAQGGEHVTVRLKVDGADGRTTPCSLVLRVEEYAALSFRALPGGRLAAEQYDELARAAQASDAYNRGLCVLGYGANSARTLHRKLTQKGYEQEAATRAVETLRERGYLCEERDAMRAAYAIMRRGRGARRILQELRAKGYGDEALSAVAQALREEDFVPICVDTVRRKSPRPPADPAERKKLIAYLLRCGFEASEVREALTEAWECTN